MSAPKQRIAVLGGGMSSLTAVYELTSLPDWRERYEITVYQLGWRLGGKGASSVNPRAHQRVEEHGLHVWFGFYQNAFNLMMRCYEELGRTPDQPLARVEDAFIPMNGAAYWEQVEGEWRPWVMEFPHDGDFPGRPRSPRHPDAVRKYPTPLGFIARLLGWLGIQARQIAALIPGGPAAETLDERPPWWGALVELLGRDPAGPAAPLLASLAEAGAALARRVEQPAARLLIASGALAWLIERFRDLLRALVEPRLDGAGDRLRRTFILADLSASSCLGMLRDEVPVEGFSQLDDEDFRAWLRRHGAREIGVDSAVIRTLYDVFFGYEGGDVRRPNAAAGATLRGILRLLFTYRGAIMYKMAAGMGETVFAPLYQVLRRRGVRFEFFHRVDALHLDQARRGVAAISMTRQATVAGAAYEPLVPVAELPVWPPTPDYDQLVEGDRLREAGVDLESAWSTWPGVEERRLVRGRDFDQVLLGISLGALNTICAELIAADPRWRAMVEGIGTVATQAVQLWLRRDLRSLGNRMPHGMIASYEAPFSSWSDFSQLIAREGHPPGEVAYVAYSCGVLDDRLALAEGLANPDYPHEEHARVTEHARSWLREHGARIWPGAAGDEGFDWSLLVGADPGRAGGDDPLASQYLRANLNPSDRYVQALAGTTKLRMRVDESGFEGLTLTGTWTDNNYTLSCIEAAAMAGRQAARAISGVDLRIPGEEDL